MKPNIELTSITNQEQFRTAALAIYHHQVANCEPYRHYVELLGVDVQRFEEIPYLPIELFKSHRIYSCPTPPEVTFTSSGTTGDQTSRHHVASRARYEESFLRGFATFYGPPSDYSIFALLPSYLERQSSSLIYMVEKLQSLNPTKGGFFLYDFEKLSQALQKARLEGEKILLIGVTFALLDFAERYPQDLRSVIVMETGGMKGRRQEIARETMHSTLCVAFNIPHIHSEYGMTEMLSQCYSAGEGLFQTPPWVGVSARSLQNPLAAAISKPKGSAVNEINNTAGINVVDQAKVGAKFAATAMGGINVVDQAKARTKATGGINIIDLANVDSCSFLATGDYGTVYSDGSFEIHGRLSSVQLRGCNMLTE